MSGKHSPGVREQKLGGGTAIVHNYGPVFYEKKYQPKKPRQTFYSNKKYQPKQSGRQRHPIFTSRGASVLDLVPCCAAEAISSSLRMAGVPVDDRDTLALYRSTPPARDDGRTIVASLAAASRYGLAGVRLAEYDLTDEIRPSVVFGVTLAIGGHALVAGHQDGTVWSWGDLYVMPAHQIEESWELRWDL